MHIVLRINGDLKERPNTISGYGPHWGLDHARFRRPVEPHNHDIIDVLVPITGGLYSGRMGILLEDFRGDNEGDFFTGGSCTPEPESN